MDKVLHIRRVALNILNKQSRTADKGRGCLPAYLLSRVLTTIVAKCHAEPRRLGPILWKDLSNGKWTFSYHVVQCVLYCRLLSKTVKIKTYKPIILLFCMSVKFGFLH
jgi:hypothetical protein